MPNYVPLRPLSGRRGAEGIFGVRNDFFCNYSNFFCIFVHSMTWEKLVNLFNNQ